MTVITNPISVLIYFITIGINIAFFFLIVRLILAFKSFRLLVAFDKIGEKLVDTITEIASKLLLDLFNRNLSTKKVLVISILFLTWANVVLTWVLTPIF